MIRQTGTPARSPGRIVELDVLRALAISAVLLCHLPEYLLGIPGLPSLWVCRPYAGILGLGLFVILSWKSYEYALSLKNAHEVTAASRIPLYPLVIWVSVSCIPLCLVLLKDIYSSAIEVLRK